MNRCQWPSGLRQRSQMQGGYEIHTSLSAGEICGGCLHCLSVSREHGAGTSVNMREFFSQTWSIDHQLLMTHQTNCSEVRFWRKGQRVYINEIIGDHQYGFRRNRSSTDQIFYIRQILEKNGNIMGRCISYLLTSKKPMTQLRDKFCNILLEFGIPKNLVRLIKMSLKETYSKVCIGKFCLINLIFRMG
jgi:hypothetical protein